jgi:hypothetical protein
MPINGMLPNDRQHIKFQFSGQTCPAAANGEQENFSYYESF